MVLESFLEWGDGAVTRLRGEFAFALADTAADRVYLARDPLGVKPLYWSRPAEGLHVASEVKALTGLGAPVSEVPPGHHGWARRSTAPVLRPYVDLLRLGDDQAAIEDPDEAAKLVRAALEDSIRVRVDTDLTVGVILSGGLDSTLTLLHVREMHPDCVAFTIGAPASEDLRYARRLTADLGVPHEVIEVRPRDIRLADIRAAIRLGELTEYGDIINEVVSVPLFRRIHRWASRWCCPGTVPTSCSAATRCTPGQLGAGPAAVPAQDPQPVPDRVAAGGPGEHGARHRAARAVPGPVPGRLALRLPARVQGAGRPGQVDPPGGIRGRAARLHPAAARRT